jgi:hypothetical protein
MPGSIFFLKTFLRSRWFYGVAKNRLGGFSGLCRAMRLLSKKKERGATSRHLLTIKTFGMQIPDNFPTIARIIRKDWKKIYFGAVPYLDAMECLTSIQGNYLEDSASSIVNYFLANAQTWRGETARAVKEKLKQLLRQK